MARSKKKNSSDDIKKGREKPLFFIFYVMCAQASS